MVGSGTLGDTAYREQWQADSKKGTITMIGDFGATHENLLISGHGSNLDGAIGTLEVHEHVHYESDGKTTHVTWDGTSEASRCARS